jgi:hypothetical protein
MKKSICAALVFASILAAFAGQANSGTTPSFDAGFQERATELRQIVEKKAQALDVTYNFKKIAVNGNLPAVVLPIHGNQTPSKPCGDDGICVIFQKPRQNCKADASGGACNSVSWRDFLFEDLPSGGSVETLASKDAADFEMGKSAADFVLKRNLKSLDDTYRGMLAVRQMQNQGLLSQEQPAKKD